MANMVTFTAGGVQYTVRDPNAVHYNAADGATDAQKAQALENIGGASAAEVADLKSAVNTLALFGEYSLLSGIEWTSGYYLQSDGTTATHNRFFLSDYIDISGFNKIRLKNNSSNILRIAQYNSSKVYISSTYINVSTNSMQVATIDTNAKYILVSVGNWNTTYSLDVLLSNAEVNGNNVVSDTNALANQNKTDIDSIKKYLTNIINVVDLGVDNTGEADVTSSLITIITNAPDGSVIYFPKGTYLTTSTINIKNRNNITILGEGNISGTIIRYTGAYSAFTIVGGDTVAIKNLAIYGINNPQRGITYDDETITSLESRAFNMVVEDVRIVGFGTGIALWSPTGYVYFRGVIVTNLLENGIGFDLGGSFQNTAEIMPNYVYLEHCIVENISGSGRYGVRVTCGQAVFIHDCDICNFTDGTAISVSNTNSYNRKCEDIYILNNSIYNNFRGVVLQNQVDNYFIRNINISNNMIRIHGNGYGINFLLEENAFKFQNVTVVGNVFSGFSGNTPTNLTGLSNIVIAARYLAGVGIET